MKKLTLIIVMSIVTATTFSQTEKFDIATYVPPPGWQRIDSNGIVCFLNEKTNNGLTSFCQIFLYKSLAGSGNADKDFKSEWTGRVVRTTKTNAKPAIDVEKTPEGWTVTTGLTNITHQGITYTCVLKTASGFGKVMSVMVNLAGQDYVADVDKFFNSFELDSKSTPTTAKSDNKTNDNLNNNNHSPNSNLSNPLTLQDYSFNPPARWYKQNATDYILLSQYQTTQYGCLISILPPQVSSGDLETDAKAMFNKIYSGWQFRYTGEKQNDISKGHTYQGLEFCRMEASMQKPRPDGYYYDYEDGDVIAIKAGTQVTFILSQHNRGEMVCFCKHQYEYWGNFFNSFSIKNQSASNNSSTDISGRAIGSWQSLGSVLMKYIFAANGHYQFIGAYSTVSRISRDYIEMKTSGFRGDGTYSFKGNQFTTVKDGQVSVAKFRMEKVNHGNSGWNDRIYLLEMIEGKPNEVCYEKQVE